jgi:hypothetical protein
MPKTSPATNGEADQEAIALLRESATPDLYHRNGFRVLELPVDASTKEVNRRKQMVEMAATNGVPLPPGPGRSFPLDPAPDEFTVRDAVQRLGDPERRLVDEFFWFWPHEQGQSKSDQGLQHLAQGNHERASEIWSQQEANQSVSHVSTHNLAVLHHLLALQWENHAQSNEVNGDEQKNIEQLWNRAFRRWQKLLDEEGFWSRLKARVREFGDPRLTAGTVRRLRSALPAALLSINARLALQAVEQGRKGSAARLVEVIRKSGFPEDAIKDGLRQAVEPVRARIKALCKAADNSAEHDPVHADKACRQLLDNALPLLDGLDCLLASGDPTREVAHDDVAEQALRCQVAFAKKTNNWKVSVELLESAAVVATSDSVSKKLKENLETVRKNSEDGDDYCGDGYFDLPAPVLDEMEAARKLADAHDFDGAVSRLEKLLAGAGPVSLEAAHVALVNKALAYCLGCRAVRRTNLAIDEFNRHRSSVIKRALDRADSFDPMTLVCAQQGEIPAYVDCYCMACGSQITGRYTILRWSFGDKELPFLFCGSHGEQHRREQEGARSAIKDAVRKSAEDFVEASHLDPLNGFVKRQLGESRKLCESLQIPFPRSGREKNGRVAGPAGKQIFTESGKSFYYEQGHRVYVDGAATDALSTECPNGHGPLRTWEGRLRCWTCGWQPDGSVTAVPASAKPAPTSSNCFIATAAYGSPMAPEIDTLRAFRDEVLRLFLVGRLFIRTYETVSPPFAHWLARHDGLRAMVRSFLAPVIWIVQALHPNRCAKTSQAPSRAKNASGGSADSCS